MGSSPSYSSFLDHFHVSHLEAEFSSCLVLFSFVTSQNSKKMFILLPWLLWIIVLITSLCFYCFTYSFWLSICCTLLYLLSVLDLYWVIYILLLIYFKSFHRILLIFCFLYYYICCEFSLIDFNLFCHLKVSYLWLRQLTLHWPSV